MGVEWVGLEWAGCWQPLSALLLVCFCLTGLFRACWHGRAGWLVAWPGGMAGHGRTGWPAALGGVGGCLGKFFSQLGRWDRRGNCLWGQST